MECCALSLRLRISPRLQWTLKVCRAWNVIFSRRIVFVRGSCWRCTNSSGSVPLVQGTERKLEKATHPNCRLPLKKPLDFWGCQTLQKYWHTVCFFRAKPVHPTVQNLRFLPNDLYCYTRRGKPRVAPEASTAVDWGANQEGQESMMNASNEQDEIFWTWEQRGRSETFFLAPQF